MAVPFTASIFFTTSKLMLEVNINEWLLYRFFMDFNQYLWNSIDFYWIYVDFYEFLTDFYGI